MGQNGDGFEEFFTSTQRSHLCRHFLGCVCLSFKGVLGVEVGLGPKIGDGI